MYKKKKKKKEQRKNKNRKEKTEQREKSNKITWLHKCANPFMMEHGNLFEINQSHSNSY